MKKNKELTGDEEPKEVIIARLLQLIETNSIMLQNHYNEDSSTSITKQYKDLIKRYYYELAEVVSFKIKGNKISKKECVELFFTERIKIQEVQKQVQIQEEKKRKDSELGRDNIILMLVIHRNFAKESFFGHFETLKLDGSIETIESEEFKLLKDNQLIDFTTFARFMTTDEIINSYSEDLRVNDFTNNLIRRFEYDGQDLEWNISMIDIEILFDVLRENQFISSDTPRSIFFEIFNPHLSVFNKPVVWKDIKELAYFLDKCKEYSLFENYKYQNIVEKYRMFKTNHSKGDFVKSNSLRTTLSDVKDEFGNYSEDKEFLKRVKFLEEMFDGMDCCSNKILTEEDDD
jgi:hypothetical protein